MVRTTRGTSSDSQEVEEEDDESIYRRRNIGRQGNARVREFRCMSSFTPLVTEVHRELPARGWGSGFVYAGR